MSDLNKPAMPHYDTDKEKTRPGLTIRQHAAITLRVPMSGDPELDAMIREARRLDMATAAMQGMLADSEVRENGKGWQNFLECIANDAADFADAMLAASEPKKAEPCSHPEVFATTGYCFHCGEYVGEQPDAEGRKGVRNDQC